MSGIELVKLDPGLQSLARATVTPASIRRRASGYGWRVENSTPGSSVATVSEPASAAMSSSSRYVQWSTDAAPSATAICTPSPRPSWLPCTRGSSPWTTPAARMRRLSSGAKAPRSQNTSIQRLCGAHACSMSAAHQLDVLLAAIGVLGGHDVRTEERDLGRHFGCEAGEARLIVDREPVAGLDLERRRALRLQLGDESGEAPPQLVVTRRPRRGHGAAYAAGGIGRTGHPRLELVRAVAAEDEVGVRVDEPGDDGPAPGIHHRRGVGRDLGEPGPTHAMRPPSISTAASCSVPHGSPAAATLVVSSPMFVISVALTASAPSGRARARPLRRGRSRRPRAA